MQLRKVISVLEQQVYRTTCNAWILFSDMKAPVNTYLTSRQNQELTFAAHISSWQN